MTNKYICTTCGWSTNSSIAMSTPCMVCNSVCVVLRSVIVDTVGEDGLADLESRYAETQYAKQQEFWDDGWCPYCTHAPCACAEAEAYKSTEETDDDQRE